MRTQHLEEGSLCWETQDQCTGFRQGILFAHANGAQLAVLLVPPAEVPAWVPEEGPGVSPGDVPLVLLVLPPPPPAVIEREGAFWFYCKQDFF